MANYIYPDTGILKNKFNVSDGAKFRRLEARFVAARRAEIAAGFGPKGQFDAAHLKAIHRHLYQDIYEWAGRTRDEPVTLSDSTVATEPELSKQGGREFLYGRFIPTALDEISQRIRQNHYLRGLSREEFIVQAAGIIADLNSVHPFRKGNGHAQRCFLQALAKEAGQTLDFTGVSRERMRRASIAAHELNDNAEMRDLISEISDPARTQALRVAAEFFDTEGFAWNDYFVATAEPGTKLEAVMAGVTGKYFIARSDGQILIGKLSDLPKARPESGETFMFTAS